jgi:hypothetical protein
LPIVFHDYVALRIYSLGLAITQQYIGIVSHTLQQALKKVRLCQIIRLGYPHVLTACELQATLPLLKHRTTVGVIDYDARLRMHRVPEFLEKLEAAVAGAVVEKYDFVDRHRLRSDARQPLLQIVRIVEIGYDHGYPWHPHAAERQQIHGIGAERKLCIHDVHAGLA